LAGECARIGIVTCSRHLILLAVLLLVSCSAGSEPWPAPSAVAGQWRGLAFGETESIAVLLVLVQDGRDLSAELHLPTLPSIEEATGWGNVDGGSISLALTDKSGRSVFVTGVLDEIGAELTGEMAVGDDGAILTFDLFKQ